MSDLLSDLQADLAAAPPLPSAPVPPAASVLSPTPAVELRVTPLRWAPLRVTTEDGVAVRLGPVRVRFSRR